MSDSTHTPRLDRRRVLGGVAALGIATPLLAACGEEETAATASTSPDLVAAGDVPVGGGVILKERKVVVTQPTEGDFKAFSAICTHQGCLVGSVEDNTISCACHGSEFSAEDGSVVTGPATSPLDVVAVAVKGDQVAEQA